MTTPGMMPTVAHSGLSLGRDTLAAIEQAGFTVKELDRFRFPDMRLPLPTAPHILGIATKPR